jgi:hypothetical protein
MRRRGKKGNLFWGIFIGSMLLVSGIFVVVSLMVQSGANIPNTQEAVKDKSDDSTYLDKSVLNGAPFLDLDVYHTYDDKILHYAYITVLPTVDDITNETVTLADLNKITKPDDNRAVEVLFQEGDKEGPSLDIYKSTVIRPNGTMKVRGFSSRGFDQKSFKVRLSGVTNKFLGQDILNFNKHASDPLRAANKFCMDALETIPDMGSLDTYFVKIYIRDLSKGGASGFENYGLFTMVEQPNRAYLSRHGLGKKSSLYKAEAFAFGDFQTEIKSKDDPYYDEALFETVLDIRENPDHDKLIEMIDAVNDTSNDINDVLNTYFNRENYLTWMATNIIFGNIDAVVHNYLLYSPVNSKTWYFLPWDYDGTILYSKKLLYERKDYPISYFGIGNFWGAKLHNRFFKDPKNVKDLSDKIDTIMRKYLSPKDCEELASEYIKVYEEAVFGLPDARRLRINADEMAYYSQNIYDILKGFVDLYYENSEAPMPIYFSDPVRSGNEYSFVWDQSYDLQGDLIYYSIAVARDVNFNNIVFSKEDMLETSYKVNLDLDPDTYFFRVLLKDEHGNEQLSLERYHDPNSEDVYYGQLSFEVE